MIIQVFRLLPAFLLRAAWAHGDSGATSRPIPTAPLNASVGFQSGTAGNVASVATSGASGIAEASGSIDASSINDSGATSLPIPTAPLNASAGLQSGTAGLVAHVPTDPLPSGFRVTSASAYSVTSSVQATTAISA
ncbi:hypothetical protein DFH07DRAFT_956133 [Mycena maculata]|uniref:Uncharacterized protein n=1 Tax=Mycena maculata TaxID=230809 RepID=A0AAD7JG48_9AGAR|nr:hypothetical protein DFH07DRAFT_956133 [Mycena maculata]